MHWKIEKNFSANFENAVVEQHTLLSDKLLFKINKTKNKTICKIEVWDLGGVMVKLSLTNDLISIALPWLRIPETVLRTI